MTISVEIDFNPPVDTGGLPVTSYTVVVTPGNFSATGPSSPITVSGLSYGVPYTFVVTATNSLGTGYPSAPVGPITFTGTSNPPTGLTAVAGNAQAMVSFTAPDDGGAAISSYTVTSAPGGLTATGSASPIVVTGLTNGVTYTFTATATNSNGTSGPSAPSNAVTPSTVPDAPTIGTATAYNSYATVAFTPPANTGGSAIVNYVALSNPGGITAYSTTSPITVQNLVNGTAYTFTVAAINGDGTGAYSAASNSVTPSTPATVPGQPTNVTAQPGNAQALVSFFAPNTGGSPITGYTVTASPGGATGTGTSGPITVTGLTNGTQYTFTVTATNAIGTGPASAPSAPVTPFTVPGAPTAVAATAGILSATITFSAPAANGSPIQYYTATTGALSAQGAGSPIIFTGLAAETSYSFTVTANNAAGAGAASAASNAVTPYTVPAAPTGVTASGGESQALVAFTAPDDGGSPITLYTVTSSGGQTAAGGASPIIVSGLTDGISYTFTVTATNAAGVGPASAPSNAIEPGSLPGAPLAVVATPGNSSASVAFSPPASSGGTPILSYTVTSSPGGFTATGVTSPLTVLGLTNGTPYTFVVTATTIIGTGPASAPSAAVTPEPAAPSAPLSPSAVAGNGLAVVSFLPPASSGGANISSYRVTSSGGQTATGSGSPITVSGLTNGTSYTFTVTATNAGGTGPASVPTNAITPSAVPGMPTGVVATGGNGQASVAFVAPNNGGSPITSYTATSVPGGFSATGAASPLVVMGLTNGVSYTFTVTATNANGQGPASNSSNAVTPATVPGAPLSLVATAGNAQASVAFSPPTINGGSAISSYRVTSNGGQTATGATSPIVITGLTNGTSYTFTATASNAIGTGPASIASTAVTPSAPQGFVITTTTLPGASLGTAYSATITASGSTFTPYTYYNSTSLPPGIILSTSGALSGTPTVDGSYSVGFYAVDNSGTTTTATATVVGNNNGTGNANVPTDTIATTSISALIANGPVMWFGTVATYNANHNARTLTASPTIPSITLEQSIQGPNSTQNPNAINASQETDMWWCTGTPGGTTTFTCYWGTVGDTDYLAAWGVQHPVGTTLIGTSSAAQTGTQWAGVAQGSLLTSGYITVAANQVPCRLYGVCENTSSLGTNYIPTVGTITPQGGSALGPMTLISNFWNFNSSPSVNTSTFAYFDITQPGNYQATFVQPSSSAQCSQTFGWIVQGPSTAGAQTPVKNLTIAVTGATLPTAPLNPSATAGNASATVTFTAPSSNGGSTITSYKVTSNPGGVTATGTSSPITVTGLTNGIAYTFTVTATNGVGTGPASVTTNSVTPAGVPGPVSNVVATAGNAQATVTYNAPAVTGGSAITGYKATATPGGAFTSVFSATPVPITVTGLTNGTAYTIGVHAFNAIGIGTPDVQSNSVTPVAPSGSRKQNIISYFTNLPNGTSNRVVSGQYTDIFNVDQSNNNSQTIAMAMDQITPLPGLTGQQVGMQVWVMNYVGPLAGATPISTMEQGVANAWGNNSFVVVTLYSGVPNTNTGTCVDHGSKPNGPVDSGTFTSITTTGNAYNNYWLAQCQLYANECAKLVASGHVILWKPFIEINAGNWYSAQNAAQFQQLWIQMWNVFQATQVNGQSLNNFLIWVYNVNQDQGGYTSYFPGTAYCDMTSGDAYSQVSWDPNGGQPYPAATLAQFEQKVSTFYSALKSLGLPVGFGECGLATNTYNQMYSNPNNFTQDSTQYINAIRNQAPGISFFLVFCGGWAINSQNNASALLNDAWVVNLADIPAGLN